MGVENTPFHNTLQGLNLTNIIFTDEQQLIFDELISPTSPIVTIKATARIKQDDISSSSYFSL